MPFLCQNFTIITQTSHGFTTYTENKITETHLSVSYQKSVDWRQLDGASLSPVVVVGLGEQQLTLHCEPYKQAQKVQN